MRLVDGYVQVGWTSEEQSLVGLRDVLEEILRTVPVHLVRVGVSSRSRIEWDLDLLIDFFSFIDSSIGLPRMGENIVHSDRTLALLGQNIVEIDVLFEIGVALSGSAPLLARERKDADHSDIAVGPRLLRYPIDQVVMAAVFLTVVTFGFT